MVRYPANFHHCIVIDMPVELLAISGNRHLEVCQREGSQNPRIWTRFLFEEICDPRDRFIISIIILSLIFTCRPCQGSGNALQPSLRNSPSIHGDFSVQSVARNLWLSTLPFHSDPSREIDLLLFTADWRYCYFPPLLSWLRGSVQTVSFPWIGGTSINITDFNQFQQLYYANPSSMKILENNLPPVVTAPKQPDFPSLFDQDSLRYASALVDDKISLITKSDVDGLAFYDVQTAAGDRAMVWYQNNFIPSNYLAYEQVQFSFFSESYYVRLLPLLFCTRSSMILITLFLIWRWMGEVRILSSDLSRSMFSKRRWYLPRTLDAFFPFPKWTKLRADWHACFSFG